MLVLLLLVELIGGIGGGSQRWLNLGFMTLQPSELMKPVIVLVLFAFDAGQELSEHTAPFDAFVQVLDGEVELLIGGAPVVARAGETVLMPAGIPHAVKARTRFKMLLGMLREPRPA